jgi:hypothetical protein
MALLQEGEDVRLETVSDPHDRLKKCVYAGEQWIARLELSSPDGNDECDHTYILDGFHTHNLVKG